MTTSGTIGKIDRTKWQKAHNDSVWVQFAFEGLSADDIRPGVFAYPPCWAACDPGMTLEAHEHAIPEMYFYVAGEGRMRVGEEWFDVAKGMAVNIPPNATHEVECATSSAGPVIWMSIGLSE